MGGVSNSGLADALVVVVRPSVSMGSAWTVSGTEKRMMRTATYPGRGGVNSREPLRGISRFPFDITADARNLICRHWVSVKKSIHRRPKIESGDGLIISST